MNKNIHALVTDLDGVIRFFPESRTASIELKYQLPLGAIEASAFYPHLLLPAVTGVFPDEIWREKICIDLKKKFPKIDCRSAVREWSDFSGEVAVDTLWFLRSLCSTIPFVLLTNATSRLEEDLRKLDILRTFDQIFSSSLLGFAKPDQAAFKKVTATLQIEPGNILFIDDSTRNIDAAKCLGFQTHQFSSLESLRAHLSIKP